MLNWHEISGGLLILSTFVEGVTKSAKILSEFLNVTAEFPVIEENSFPPFFLLYVRRWRKKAGTMK